MTQQRKVLIYGASGYTGKLIAECLAQRGIPFYFAGRSRARLESALEVVRQRHGGPVDAEIVVAGNTVEELVPLFSKVDVVINVAGPFMQVAWPVVEAALAAGCHYLDTTGEQDWVIAIADKFGQAFADKGLLLCPANSYMWAAGALAAEVVLETAGVDSIDLLYQIDNGLPSEASTKSFLRMVCNDVSQYYLEQGEYKAWPNDKAYEVHVPYRATTMRALPWGGACEPVWFKHDPRVRNCRVLTAIGEHLIDPILGAVQAFNQQAAQLPQAQTGGLDQRRRRPDGDGRAAQGPRGRAALGHRLRRPGPPGHHPVRDEPVGALQLDRRNWRRGGGATAQGAAQEDRLPVRGARPSATASCWRHSTSSAIAACRTDLQEPPDENACVHRRRRHDPVRQAPRRQAQAPGRRGDPRSARRQRDWQRARSRPPTWAMPQRACCRARR